MISTNNCKYYFSYFVISLLFTALVGCFGGGQVSLPDAPPPYPDDQFGYKSDNQDYTPPEAPSPRGQTFGNDRKPYERGFTQSPTNFRNAKIGNLYTIEAIGTIWVLVQDKFGNEIQWMSLLSGDSETIQHNGPIILTCSSGESLKIKDKNGKPVKPSGNQKGISIIRLP